MVLLFNLLIGVHELGHFLAAKWRGLKIDRFAIWFGKPIWKKKINGVEYALGWIPAGGYVALPQMATMEAIEGKTDETPAEPLPNVSPLDKIIVAFAGPLFSFALAFVFAFVVWGVGKPSNEGDNSTHRLAGSIRAMVRPAWQAGLRPGDTILEVDGHPVKHFAPTVAGQRQVAHRHQHRHEHRHQISARRQGRHGLCRCRTIARRSGMNARRSGRFSLPRRRKATIYDIASNSPAAQAGLKNGDEVIALNGEKIYSSDAVDDAQWEMSNSVVKPLTLTIRRGNEQFDRTLLAVKPLQPTNTTPLLGIMSWLGDTNVALVHPNPMEQIQASAGADFQHDRRAVLAPRRNRRAAARRRGDDHPRL